MATMWHAKSTGSYSRTSQEGIDNATLLASSLISKGWTLTAVSAMLGNGAGESGLNPWRWESDYVPTVAQFNSWTADEAQRHGYGLFGFTPASTYINVTNQKLYSKNGYAPNFSDKAGKASDGEAQTLYFSNTIESAWSHNLYNYYKDNFADIGVDIETFYWITYSEFISSIRDGKPLSLEESVGAFELCYEKPADWAASSSFHTRVDNALYWYEYFGGTPIPIRPTQPTKMPLWMMLRPHYKFTRRF